MNSLSPIYKSHRKPVLTTLEEDHGLFMRYKAGDRSAGDTLILNNTALVVKLANQRSRKYSFDDLVSEGFIGMRMALNKYDPKYNVKFGVYAMAWIVSYMSGYMRKAHSTVQRWHGYPEPDVRLDEPLKSDSDFTLLDMLADESANADEVIIGYETKQMVRTMARRCIKGRKNRRKGLDEAIVDRIILGGEQQNVVAADFKITHQAVSAKTTRIMKNVTNRLAAHKKELV
jgi:RNA polymerase sigma factor (sigma-70 family)